MNACGNPNCNKDREAKMIVVDRHQDGTPKTWCDPCLVPLVRALNEVGLRTIASCCGHGRRPAQIVLADGREIIVARSFGEARLIDGAFPDINAQFRKPR